jgi:hypothetical protein
MPVCQKPNRKKLFGMPPSSGIDRNQRHRVITFAKGWNAAHREPGQHIGPITRTAMLVLRALLYDFANHQTGSCFPSYEAIAEKAGCARSTVAEALRILEFAGVLRIYTRLKRAGGRVLRTSNAYVFRDMIPESENRPGTKSSKDSVISPDVSPVKIIVLDPSNALDAALIALGRSTGGLPKMA